MEDFPTLNVYAHFFGGFFAVIPLCFLVGIFHSVKRAMWACASD